MVAPRNTESKTVSKTLEGPAQKYYVERPAQKYHVEGGRLRNIMLRYFNYFEIIQSLQCSPMRVQAHPTFMVLDRSKWPFRPVCQSLN